MIKIDDASNVKHNLLNSLYGLNSKTHTSFSIQLKNIHTDTNGLPLEGMSPKINTLKIYVNCSGKELHNPRKNY